MHSQQSAGKRFRDSLSSSHCLIGPGVFDGISTTIASSIAGVDFLYLTRTGATASLTGQPTPSTTTSTELVDLARMVSHTTHLPVIADAATGFGGPINIQRTVHLHESAGVAGLHISDTTFPERSDQAHEASVEPRERFLERVRAAVQARRNPEFVIIARSEARNAREYGGEEAGEDAFLEALARLKDALDHGADMAFMDGPRSEDECRRLVNACRPKPVMIAVLPHGIAPEMTTQMCTEMGVAAAVFPCTGFLPAMLAMQRSYRALVEKGSDWEMCEGHGVRVFLEEMGLGDAVGFEKRVARATGAEGPEQVEYGKM